MRVKNLEKNRGSGRSRKSGESRVKRVNNAGKDYKKKDKKERKDELNLGAYVADRRDYPDAVIKETDAMPDMLSEEEITRELSRGRRDLRKMTMCTIDGDDTKDVDDAVSLRVLENGHYLLGVHIADVSHYVTKGSATDEEAYKRGTSVYFPNLVLPMLPKKLSNGICSLNVGEDRFALSVSMEIDENGIVVRHEIFESVVNIRFKISYSQIDRLYAGDAELKERYKEQLTLLDNMCALADIRHEMRNRRGAIDFDFPELKVEVDGNGMPVKLHKVSPTFANNLIEEFMLAANETVAEHFEALKVPFMYRNHEEPELDALEKLNESVRGMGLTLRGRESIPGPESIRLMLDKAKGMRIYPIIQLMALRSLPKAFYGDENLGHFGLHAEYYCHFTSPIRRYPDLYIHRVIKKTLHGGLSAKEAELLANSGEADAEHCSETEREAELAERMYTDILVAQYMAEHVGEKYPATITSITSFGMFAEIENGAEGLIFYNNMKEYMSFDSKRLISVGEHTGRKYAIGDKINIIVSEVKVKTGQIEFLFA